MQFFHIRIKYHLPYRILLQTWSKRFFVDYQLYCSSSTENQFITTVYNQCKIYTLYTHQKLYRPLSTFIPTLCTQIWTYQFSKDKTTIKMMFTAAND